MNHIMKDNHLRVIQIRPKACSSGARRIVVDVVFQVSWWMFLSTYHCKIDLLIGPEQSFFYYINLVFLLLIK